ncbi:hypothetical protein EDB81DRAFT_809641 [Dactylonectria macrodidyma]|uniref:Uncharacterized protein n=1 Tax=Dactylonectria macrodidyma TaxID=307937 RepID=A0A9P9INY7_9HYPO|nr:hypothetical protein EDB81DRAFT_809641 [Dactylonectria macrodidyma]
MTNFLRRSRMPNEGAKSQNAYSGRGSILQMVSPPSDTYGWLQCSPALSTLGHKACSHESPAMKTQDLYATLRNISRRFLLSHRNGGRVQQDIGVNNIDPIKLAQKLSSTFEPGDFEVDLIHNTYIIRASRKLSANEIADCR